MKVLILGLISGIVASVLAVFIIRFMDRRKLKNNLEKYTGKWTSHPMINSEPDREKVWGTVTITHEVGNILDFYYENANPQKQGIDWRGKLVISKEFTDTGRLVWHYIE